MRLPIPLTDPEGQLVTYMSPCCNRICGYFPEDVAWAFTLANACCRCDWCWRPWQIKGIRGHTTGPCPTCWEWLKEHRQDKPQKNGRWLNCEDGSWYVFRCTLRKETGVIDGDVNYP